jgi:hypothetical protein
MKTKVKPLELPLKDKTVYLNHDGKDVTIMGPTKPNPEYVWSLQGDWYVRATGQAILHWNTDGTARIYKSHWRNILMEMGPYK